MDTDELNLRKHLFALERRWARVIMQTPKGSTERKIAYAEAYSEVHRFIAENFPGQISGRKSLFLDRARMLHTIEGSKTRTTKFLEIGCDRGDLLIELAAQGWDVYGIDVNPVAIAGAQAIFAEHELPSDHLFVGELAEYREENFDIIYHSDVLEHMHPDSVDEFCGLCFQKLKPGGMLVVITPHVLRGPSDVSKFFLPKGVAAQGLHLKEYSLKDLKNILGPLGFELRTLPLWNQQMRNASSRAYRHKLLLERALRIVQPAFPALVARVIDRVGFMPVICLKPEQ